LPDDFQIVLYGVEERALLEDHVVQVLEKGGEFGDGFGNGCDLGDREGDGEMRDARCEMRDARCERTGWDQQGMWGRSMRLKRGRWKVGRVNNDGWKERRRKRRGRRGVGMVE
jgi:hypothetical protein